MTVRKLINKHLIAKRHGNYDLAVEYLEQALVEHQKNGTPDKKIALLLDGILAERWSRPSIVELQSANNHCSLNGKILRVVR